MESDLGKIGLKMSERENGSKSFREADNKMLLYLSFNPRPLERKSPPLITRPGLFLDGPIQTLLLCLLPSLRTIKYF